MKYIKNSDGTVVIDGSPDEIASYHRCMIGKRFTKRTPVKETYHRAPYSSVERDIIRTLVRKGKTCKQISSHLWRNKFSPHKRTELAIQIEIGRMAKDPERR